MSSPYSSLRDHHHKRKSLYPFIVVPLLSIMLIAGGLALYVAKFAQASPAQLVPLQGTIPAIVAHSKSNGQADPNQNITLSVALNLRNTNALQSYVQDTTNRKSVNFHRYLTPDQAIQAFSPTMTTHNTVLAYLKNSGFTITQTYKHRLLISFNGNIGLAEQVFHVSINNYIAPNGETFYANTSDPLLPASLIGYVQNISGLDNAARFHHAPVRPQPQGVAGTQTTSCPTNGTTATHYYTPGQMATGYNLTGMYNAGYHGEGQTIALFELATYQMSDITTFTACYGQSHTPIVTINAGGTPTASGLSEVELDAEIVLSTAPHLGQLRIYEAAPDITNSNNEWAHIIADAPPVVSDSWGACESNIGSTEAHTENNFFLIAQAQGQSIFVASDDTGSSGCYNYNSTILNAEDPATNPYVTGVGGTSLTLNADNTYNKEVTWNNPTNVSPTGASGGGISQFWSMPKWQSAPGVINSYTTGVPCNAPSGSVCRESPDVSLSSDPQQGFVFYCTVTAGGCSTSQPWLIAGGTSCAAPMWAAFMALTNEESLRKGGFNLGAINPLLYQLASNPTSYANDFHDVTLGTNDYANLQGGKYPATPVYDMATGLGSYNAANLANDLVNLALSAPGGARLSPAAPTWYFAEGYIGNGFEELLTVQNPSLTQTATVTFTYIFPNGSPKVVTHLFNASSRGTVDVNNDLNLQPNSTSHITVSTIVQVAQGSPNIVVERPMYFKYFNSGVTIQSGTDVVGATQPGTSYYFPEADSRQSGSAHYYTYITMLNPSSSLVDTVTVTYYTGSCTTNCPHEQFVLQPYQRATASPVDASINLHQQLAISITSDHALVAERPMYVADNIATAGGSLTGAASEVGATAPGKDWLFAEGYTGTNFQQYFVLANFGATAANAVVTMEYNGGTTKTQSVPVPAYSHVYVNVNTINGSTSAGAAEITSDQPIVADRLMYFHQGSAHIAGISEVVGEAGPASHSVYSFSEGYTGGSGGNFQEVLTILNPTNSSETVALTIFTPSAIFQQQQVIAAHSRWTFNINAILNPIQQGANSITLQTLNGGVIVAERPMYYTMTIPGISGIQQGGTDVLGFTG